MMSVSNWCVALSMLVLTLTSCSPVETEPQVETQTPEQVIEQFQTSYIDRNIEDFSDCLADSFMFVLHENDWGWNPEDPDSCWFLNTELTFTEELFLSMADAIELQLESTPTYPWPDDSTALGMTCPFDLKVYTDAAHTEGYMASGNAIFRFVEISDGIWKINYWKDESDLSGSKEPSTWGYIKAVLTFS